MQLRMKLYYFTIMLLSCCDLLAVFTSNPLTALFAMLWLTGKLVVYPLWMYSWVSLCKYAVNLSGVDLNCIDVYAVLERANDRKLHVFATKHEANTYSEQLIHSA